MNIWPYLTGTLSVVLFVVSAILNYRKDLSANVQLTIYLVTVALAAIALSWVLPWNVYFWLVIGGTVMISLASWSPDRDNYNMIQNTISRLGDAKLGFIYMTLVSITVFGFFGILFYGIAAIMANH